MDEMGQAVVGAGAAFAGGIALGLSIGRQAIELGHEAAIEHVDGRFRIVCSCGWSTAKNWSRRHAFQAVTQHVIGVVAEARRGAVPNVGPAE